MEEAPSSEGLKRILERIAKDAELEVERIREETKKRTEVIIEERKEQAKRDAKDDVERVLRGAEEEAERIRRQVLSDARTKASRMISQEKQRLIEEVLKATAKELHELKKSEERYIPLLTQMIRKGAKALGGGELEILLCNEDRELASKLNLNAIARDGMEKGTRLFLGKDSIEASGGVVIRRMDGRGLVDYTFESLIGFHERALRLRIAKALFKAA
ncbi:MAG: V-type ATP synthase subunit E family protein [Candidatus Bathyarchaeia archaeon]